MKTDRIIAFTLIILCFVSAVSGFLFQRTIESSEEKDKPSKMFSWGDSGFGLKEGNIGLIEISGPIMYGSEGGFGSPNANANEIISILEKARKDKLKGILIRLNSPGGTAAASQAIYDKIMSIRKSDNIKVYSFMQDVAASGAYYIASATDVIYANPSTMTGSIGVIMQIPNFTDLGTKIGISSVTIKSGKYKDIGNSSRKMTDDEKILLQTMIDDTYGEFVNAVSKGRKLPLETVKKLGDGRIYTGNQAYKNKLVDKLGQEQDALKDLAKVLNIQGEPKLKTLTKPSWERIFDELGAAKSPLSGTILSSAEFSSKFYKIPLMLYK